MKAVCYGLLSCSLVVRDDLLPAADNWPQFRGPDGDGHAQATSLATTWSESENIAWKTPIHGRGWSSPVVWDDQIWLTTATEDGRQTVRRLCGPRLREDRPRPAPV